MKFKKNSLTVKIFEYLIIFSIIILAFLWFFQVVFLNTYYELTKTKDMDKITNKIISNYKNDKDNFTALLDNIAYENGICIEVVDNNLNSYIANSFSRGCFGNKENELITTKYKIDFISSGETKDNFKLEHPVFKDKILINSIKLEDNVYVFINTSLEPLDSTILILKNQLIYVTVIVLLLALLIAYFISKKISKPIIKISNSAKKMVNEDYDINFNVEEDIDEINELTSSLNYARNELSKSEELRREFLANVSHDLKTPLTMIKAYAEMVRDLTYKNKKKREDNLNVIIDEADRLNLLVNDILDLSKMQSMTTKLKLEVFDLKVMIDDILRRYKIYEETKGYNFEFEYENSIMINADKKKIEQVLYNLINNAINYTGKDKKVIINVIDNDDSYRVEVIDTGSGIKESDLKLIWDKYYKVDKSHKRDKIGTGLGLSIVKNILISHGFKYGVKSKVGKGTIFYFEFQKSK